MLAAFPSTPIELSGNSMSSACSTNHSPEVACPVLALRVTLRQKHNAVAAPRVLTLCANLLLGSKLSSTSQIAGDHPFIPFAAGGKPSTRLPPGELVEQLGPQKQHKNNRTTPRKCVKCARNQHSELAQRCYDTSFSVCQVHR